MKIKLLLIIFLVLSAFANAQAPGYMWAKSAQGTSWDYPYNMCKDPSGNNIITGGFYSRTITFGSYTLINKDSTGISEDFFVVKYDSSGNVVWAKSAGGNTDDAGEGVSTDAAGDIFVAGIFASDSITFGAITLTNSATDGSDDAFIAKYDSSGNVIWVKRAGGTSYDACEGICVDASGNAIIVGWFQSPSITFGSTTLICSTVYGNIFMAKYDPAGNVLWAKREAGDSYDYAYKVTSDAGKNIYVAGAFESDSITLGATTLLLTAWSMAGTGDAFLAKYDSLGNVLWAKKGGGTDEDVAFGISLDPTGNVLITGTFASLTCTFGATPLVNSGSDDIFLVKYSSSGNLIWAKGLGGSGYEEVANLAIDASGNCFLAGQFSSPSLTFGSSTLTNTSTIGYSDVLVVKYDSSGNPLWAKNAGGASSDYALGITLDASGNPTVTGSFGSTTIVFGSTILTNASTGGDTTDIFIFKLGNLTGTMELENNNIIKIYPNPTNGVFNLVISNPTKPARPAGGNTIIEIYNSLGALVLSKQTSTEQNTIELTDQANGLYFVKVMSDNKIIATQKIMKQ